MAIIPNNLRNFGVPYFTHPSFPLHGECTDFVINAGLKFDAVLAIDNSLYTAGDTITFTWGDKEQVLTLQSGVVYTEDYGLFMLDDPAHFPFFAGANALINADFDFVFLSSTFYYTLIGVYARKEGVAYNLDIYTSTGAWGYAVINYGVDRELNNNITVLCDAFKQRTIDTNYDFVGTLKSALVFDGINTEYQFNFDLAEFLHRNLFCENIIYNDYSEVGLIRQANDSCRNFKFALKQSEGWAGAYPVDDYTVLRGGLSKRDYIKWRTDFFGYYPDASVCRLMNWVKNYSQMFIEVTKNQKLFSCFFMNYPTTWTDNEHEFFVDIVDVNNDTGSAAVYTADLYGQTKNILQYSYNELGIDAMAASLSLAAVKSWRIRMHNNITSEDYFIDYRELVPNDFRENFFIFENSLGSYQTLRTVGEFEFGVEIDKAEFEKTVPVLTLVDENFMVGETYSHTFKGEVFSGWLDIEDIYNFLDFLNSENIWKQDDHHEALTPIKILKGNWRLFTNSNNGVRQYGFKFQYVEVARNKHVTDLIPY